MQSSSFFEVLKNPNDNGIIIFVLGILFILSIYHLSAYFHNRDKTYLYYSIYTFLIFFGHLDESSTGFIEILFAPYEKVLSLFDSSIMLLYNTIYFVFVFSFINLKSHSLKWHTTISKVVYLLLIITITTTLLSIITENRNIMHRVTNYIVPFFLLFGMVGYYIFYKIESSFKHYVILGSIALYTSSLSAYYDLFPEISSSIFYIGIVVENIFFSLGLGQKQKYLLLEKEESQKNLIKQLEENQQLKETIQKQLESDVITLSKQAEEAKLEKIKTKYDKELAELKVSSLRNQMNPHFIFNSLNAIKLYIIENKKQDAVYYLNKFSKLIRKILATTREKEITLAEEIDTLKLYTDIENIRFNNQIETIFTVDEKLNSNTIKIPSLLLQPFIENAIWHGLSSKKDNKKIAIFFEEDNKNHVKITISDNGIGRKKAAEIRSKKIHKKESIGIKLTEERLDHFSKNFKNNYTIDFIDLYDSENKPTGTTVVLRVPLV